MSQYFKILDMYTPLLATMAPNSTVLVSYQGQILTIQCRQYKTQRPFYVVLETGDRSPSAWSLVRRMAVGLIYTQYA